MEIKIIDLLKYLAGMEDGFNNEAEKCHFASSSKEYYKGAAFATNTIKNAFIELLHEKSKEVKGDKDDG